MFVYLFIAETPWSEYWSG